MEHFIPFQWYFYRYVLFLSIQQPNNEALIPVRTSGNCQFCFCITSDYTGRSEGDEICPYCFCVSKAHGSP
ncbi:unnamed protein product [Schistosoma rodhaini]|uniref:Uncharacterized protein n=1 Tax=Schistosoma rodhaini TaxID=6188 RepID=A0AA85FGY8_9TREM|nr:unnamed protein product [Schistosoma rodhaini]CAH8510948.1 unnamed protein product [Schistosoma rodhaini]